MGKAVKTPAVTEETVQAYLDENPEFLLGYLKAKLVGEDDEEEEAEEEEEETEEEEAEEEEEEAEEGAEDDEEEAEDEDGRAFPTQDQIAGITDDKALSLVTEFFQIEVEAKKAKNFLAAVVAVFEGDEVELEVPTLKIIAKAFGLKTFKTDDEAKLKDRINEHLRSNLGFGAEEEEEEEEAEAKGSSIASDLNAIKKSTATEKAAKTETKKVVKKKK